MPPPPEPGPFLWSARGLVVALASGVCGVGYLCRASAGLLVVPMAEELGWSMEERGHILSAFFTGYVCSQVPGGLLAQRVGPRSVLGAALVLWSVATTCAPEAADISPSVLFVSLCCMGLFQGPMTPCVGALFANWVPQTERARAITMTGVGGAGGSLSAYYEDLPPDKPSRDELKTVLESLRNPVLRSWPAIAAYVAHMGQTGAAYTLLSWLPTYLSRIFSLPVSDIGVYLAAPKLVEMVVALYAGRIADGLLRRGFSVVQARKLCTCSALLTSAFTLVVLANAEEPPLAVCCICVLFPCQSVCGAGFQAGYLDIGGRDTGVLLSCGNMLATLPGIAAPIYGAWIVSVTGSWHALFYTVSAFQVVAAAFFFKNFDLSQRSSFLKV